MSRVQEGEWDDQDAVRRHNLWRGNYLRQLRGKRGQAFLRELRDALLALPEKALAAGQIAKDGQVCALGSLALKRRVDAGESREAVVAELAGINVDQDDDDWEGDLIWEWAESVLQAPKYLAWMIPVENDEDNSHEYVDGKWKRKETTPEGRYQRMLRWVESRIAEGTAP
jgi:hypothetical protein